MVLYNSGSHLSNFGEISGPYAGIWLSADHGGAVTLVNAGQLSGLSEGIYDSFSLQMIVTNTGTILGGGDGAIVSSENSNSEAPSSTTGV